MRHTFLPALLPILLMAALTGPAALAQTQTVHVLRAQAPITGPMAKQAIEALRALDPNAQTSADGAFLKARVDASIAQEAIIQALSGTGSTYLPVHAATHRGGAASGMPAAPHGSTGLEGQQAYDAAKQRWIEEHPDAYQRLLQGEDAPANKTP